jgi:glycosyltransferase 2 family protein
VHGRDLTQLDGPRLDQVRLADLWQQVASLWTARIAHHDLSLESVMVDQQGQVWLVDFDRAEAAASQAPLDHDAATLLAALDGVADAALVRATAERALGQDTVGRVLPPAASTPAASIQAASES